MPVPAQIEFRTHTRLTGLDYRSSYGYFVTICVRNRECIFGTIADNVMSLSRRGMIVCDSWLDIPNHHSHVELDAFIILPNHIHGILLFVGDSPSVGATPASRSSRASGPTSGSLGAVVGSFKSAVTRNINRLRPGAGANLWQPSYYDHIIRNDYERHRIRDYILTNPDRWPHDIENVDGDGTDDVVSFIQTLEQENPSLRRNRDAGVAPTAEAR